MRSIVELPSDEIESTVGKHIHKLDKIDRTNKKKAVAAGNEEFEKAVQYRNKANALKDSLMKFEEVEQLLSKKPFMNTEQLCELVVEIDHSGSFAEHILDKVRTNSITKSEIVYQTL